MGGGNKSKPKPKRVRKMSKGKGVSSSTSDGNSEHSTPEIVDENLEGNVINTIDAPGRMDSAVMSGNEDSQAGAGDGEKDVKAADSKSDSLSSLSKQDSPGKSDNDEVKVSSGSSKKKGKIDKKSPMKVKTPEKKEIL